eukprot:8017634-Ditylum_brightwellii.AAC.1
MKNANGADIYLQFQQKVSPESDLLSRLGGRLLCRLIEKDPIGLLKKLNQKEVPEEEYGRNLDLFLTISQHQPHKVRDLPEYDIIDLCEKCKDSASATALETLSRVD